MDPQQLFHDHLDVIVQVVRFVARRHRLGPDETEELLSSVNLKILENDYAVLRKFRGRSTLKTYLTAVVQRHFLDQRIARWGRWRPSSRARRLGPAGILLDQLVTRDECDVTDAVTRVLEKHPEGPSRTELYELAAVLPTRVSKRFVGDETLIEVAGSYSPWPEADPQKTDADAERIQRALTAAIDLLSAEDRTILRMRFETDAQISQIARLLGLEQKPLYRRLETLLKRLRSELESRGVSREQVSALLGSPPDRGTPISRAGRESQPDRPSLY